MRRNLTAILIIGVLTGLFGLVHPASAAGIKWTCSVKKGTVEVRPKPPLDEIAGNVVVPDTINGKPVTAIGREAFAGCEKMTSVTIPEGVTAIGERAFSRCTGLTEVRLPVSLIKIDNGAFFGCTTLTSIYIPVNVNGIGDAVFFGCSKLRIYVEDQNETYVSWGGALFDKEMTHLLSYPRANGFYRIPSTVMKIGSGAFSGCQQLKSIKIPVSVTSIGNAAFFGCTGLTTVTIPSRVNQIGNYAFHNCVNLENVTFLGKPPQTVGSSAFPQTEGTFMPYYNLKWSEAFEADGSWNNLTLSARERDTP